MLNKIVKHNEFLHSRTNENKPSLTLDSFYIPNEVVGNKNDVCLGQSLVRSLLTKGFFQIKMSEANVETAAEAMNEHRNFIRLPIEEKNRFVSKLSYNGYSELFEERTADVPDVAENFTVTKDLSEEDVRVKSKWPCHGPMCWPSVAYKIAITAFMDAMRKNGK